MAGRRGLVLCRRGGEGIDWPVGSTLFTQVMDCNDEDGEDGESSGRDSGYGD